ncbi:MAG: Bug family tripartite tricarboxylate transporter substrate binding protein [Comamonas sp.]
MPHPFCPTVSFRRRSVLLGGSALLGGLAMPAWSQEVARIYVGFAAGGVTDLAARMLAPALSAELGQSFIVENRPGASSALAIKAVEASAPSSNSFVLYPTLALLGFLLNGQQPALDRITPISLLYEQFAVLAINPQVAGLENVRTLQDLLQVARAKAGALTYTSSGVGSTGHLAMEWVCSLAGVKMQHVPYKGGAPAVTDVLGGHVGIVFADSTLIAPHVKSGKVRALAVNYPVRVPGFADVPTVAEQGFKEVSAVPWVVLAGPPGMSDAAASKVAAAVGRVVAKPDIVQSMQEQNMVPRHSTPSETRQLMQRDMLAWRKIIEDNGIKL